MGSLPHIVEDCMGVLQLYSDGTVFRSNDIGFKTEPIKDTSILVKDCLFDKRFNLYLRIYKPNSPSPGNTKFPIIIYIHGGGFCVGSRVWPHIHNCCVRLASGLQAMVVAPDYRLAPEHRLPAAMEDCMEAVRWIQRQAFSGDEGNEWFADSAEFDRVYILGDSSGGNIAHHLAVWIGSGSTDVSPVQVRGYVLLAPFFGGEARTGSEQGPSEEMLSLDILDSFWRLSLPEGENLNRDHQLANPFGHGSPNLEHAKLDPILAIVGGSELLKDRVADYARRLKEFGKKIEYVEFEGKQHGFFTNHPNSNEAHQVMQLIRRFMLDN